MKATIDKAGRLVVPAELREQIGLRPGVVDIVVSGSGLRIEFPTDGVLVEEDGLLLIECRDLYDRCREGDTVKGR